jgi:outer membrane protein OmpA-like peptidoglycan-associated protein
MAIELNKKSGEEKPRFNLSKSDESSTKGNDSIRNGESKKKFDLSKSSQPTAQVKEEEKLTPTNHNKIILFSILGIICLAALIWFVTKPGESTNQQNAGTEQPTSSNQISSDNNTTSNSEGNSNQKLVEQSQPQVPAAAATIPSQESPANTAKNEGENIPKQEAPVIANIPYKKDVSYQVYQFPFGASDYSQANPELDKLVEALKQNPSMKISITAFTDDIGDADYNKDLSELRAKSILDYLQKKGIDLGRMKSQGKGISTKYATKAENRRAEFVLNE